MKTYKHLLPISALAISALSLSAATVCYDSNVPGGANDGSSWANAFSDLATAIAAAGDGGEVHVKQGVHYPRSSAADTAIQLLNIKLIGGYTGTDADSRSNDPRTTVFCGDIGNNDIYLDAGGATIADSAVEGTYGRAFNPTTGAFINFRPWTPNEGYWKLSTATYSDNVQKLFTVPDTVTSDFEMRIEGITFTGFGRNNNGSIITTGKYAHMVITNCDFIANFSLPPNYPGIINLQSDSNVEDCRFLGTHGGQIIYTLAGTPSTNAVVRGCEMKYIYSADAKMGCPAGVNARIGKCYLSVLNSDFDYFYARSTQYNAGGVVIGRNAGNPIAVDNCTIRHVTSLGNTTVANSIVTASTFSNSEISDCVFEGDSLSDSLVSATTLDHCKSSTTASPSMKAARPTSSRPQHRRLALTRRPPRISRSSATPSAAARPTPPSSTQPPWS